MSYFSSRVRKQIENEDREAWRKVMEFYQKEFLCDIKLTVGNESRSAHRIVLSSLCPKGPWTKEKTASSIYGDESFQIDVSDVFKTPETFATIIDYIYLGTIRLKTETILQTLEVATQLNLTDLVIHCSQFLLEHMRIKNVLSLWNLAHEMELRQLAEVCRVLTRELFRDVLICSDDMKLLSVAFMEMLLDQKYVIDTVEPIEIARFILKWFVEDTKERLQTARGLISKTGICQSELCQIFDSICQDHEIESKTLQEMLHGCCTSILLGKRLSRTGASTNTSEAHINCASQHDVSAERESLPLSCSKFFPDGDGGWMLMVRDNDSTTVFCQKSKTWLEFPNISNPYIVGLSDRKYLACTKQLFARSFQIMDFTRLHQPGSIEERRLMDDAFPDPEYIWYLCNKKKWYLASLIVDNDKYSLLLHEWDDINGVFVIRRSFKTSLLTQWTVRGFTYFNENNYTLILIIASPSDVAYRGGKVYDAFYLFRVIWKKETLIEEVVKDLFYHRCFSLNKDSFLYHNDLLYIFDQGLVKNLVHAIEYNVPVTITAIAFDIKAGNSSSYKSIQLPQPGLNILPLKSKSSQAQHVFDTEPTRSSDAATSFLVSDFTKGECSHVSVIDDKLFLVIHRAPGIVQAFILDIFKKSWEFTPPLPLTALSDIKVNSFYSDCSLHEGFPEAKKHFRFEDFPIFENWCLQQWQGVGDDIEINRNCATLTG